MNYEYQTRGTCSRQIRLQIDSDGLLQDVVIEGGCSGYLQGVMALVEGRPAEEVRGLLSGIRCGDKRTSCPDQLATAIGEALDGMGNPERKG